MKITQNYVAAFLVCFATSACIQAQTPCKPRKNGATKAPRPLSKAEVVQKWQNSVYTLQTYGDVGAMGGGTGFAIGGKWPGIMTCFHVIAGISDVRAHLIDKKIVRLPRLLSGDRLCDFAILGYFNPRVKPVELDTTSSVRVGDTLYIIGSPFDPSAGAFKEGVASEGRLLGKRIIGGLEFLEISNTTEPGSSGGPVFNVFGRVVGMVRNERVTENGVIGGYAISMKSIYNRLDKGLPLASLVGNVPAPHFDEGPDTLKLIGSLWINVALTQRAMQGGIDAKHIHEDVSRIVERAGIRIISPDDGALTTGNFHLQIEVDLKPDPTGRLLYTVHVQLRQAVRLLGFLNAIDNEAITYEQVLVDYCSSPQATEVDDAVTLGINEFCSDWATHRPK